MLIHRDFEDEIANFGDVVNTRKPGEFESKRKTNTDDVTIQDATATNVAVPLDQHVHVSFMIRDGEESKSFKSLVDEYLSPAMLAQARFIDQVVLGQYHHFLSNTYGQIDGLDSSTAKDYILGVRNVMNKNKVYPNGRNLILTPDSETSMLGTELFLSAEKVGDDGTALREASLGRKLGMTHWMSQNSASPSDSADTTAGAINNASGYSKGDTSLTVDGFAAAISNNSWITIVGDKTPHRVVSTTGGSTPTAITIASPGLRHDVSDDAVVTVYDPGAVNNGSGYSAGYSKEIAVDGFTEFPQVGQMVTFGTDSTSTIYTIIQADSSDGTILLDRPLVSALSDDDEVNPGPVGNYNLAFHRNALALVTRPLAAPRAGTGALSAVVNYNGLSMRATITYNGTSQGHLVTLDMLCGIALLDSDLGAVLFG